MYCKLTPLLEPVNKAGESVLSIACTKGHIAVIDYLVKDKGMDLNGENINPSFL